MFRCLDCHSQVVQDSLIFLHLMRDHAMTLNHLPIQPYDGRPPLAGPPEEYN